MRFLFIVRQKKNVDTFQDVILRLLDGGHEVRLAIQERVDAARSQSFVDAFSRPGFELVACPEGRGDQWRASAPLNRTARDWAQYLSGPYRTASKLRARAADRLLKELGLPDELADTPAIDPQHALRIQRTLAQIEQAIPSDRLHEEFIARQSPDVVLVTPGLHFGSAQADVIKSARACGIPVWMLLFSWDNLSTKGALHEAPDLMFVWNERQRREAAELHGFPMERVIVAGAPRFDEFFALSSVVPRAQFLGPLRLDAGKPTLLYVASSRFIAERELPFIRQWLAAIRSAAPPLRDCNVIVRPHPDIALVEDGPDPETVSWPSMPQATGWVERPFDDPQALVLRTTYRTPQAFFECLHHSAAVVGLNTSAELEAGIAGRPVFTLVVRDEGADGQLNTLHFNYLLREQGGFVSCAPDMAAHLADLTRALASPPDATAIRSFIDTFLRPLGQGPVSAVLADALVTQAANAKAAPVQTVAMQGAASAVAAPDERDLAGSEETRKTVVLGYPGSTARVLATPETRPTRRKGVLVLDETTVAWLDEHVRPGDVVYDIGAGVGVYALVVALHRGGLSVAFEPGFASFKRLCDNLLLNGCYRSVIPLPLALGDRTGLLELEYAGEAGGHGSSLRPRPWRTRRDGVEAQYAQPVCAERLDDVVERHGLAKPRVVRIALRRGAVAALRGAAATLRDGAVHSVLASVKGDDEAAAVAGVLEEYGFATAVARGSDINRTVVSTRAEARPPQTPRGLLRRVTGRMTP